MRDEELHRAEGAIGRLLMIGVAIAAAVVFVGALLYLVRHGKQPADYHIFHGEPTDLRSVGGAFKLAATFSARGIIQLGLVILVAVQVVRVILTAWLFRVLGDRFFVGVSLFVLAVLVYSLAGGVAL